MSRVKDVDRGWKRIEAAINELEGLEVVVGIQSDEAGPETGFNMAALAATHEFGTDRAGKSRKVRIPERSFLRSTFDEKRAEIEHAAQRTIALILDGRHTVQGGLGRFGQFVQLQIKAKVRSNIGPPNAISTIQRKIRGKKARARALANKTLIDTGRMLGSITYAIRPKGTTE